MQSGTKLVLLLAGLALFLAGVSWWNRFDSAHRSTTFWGPENARLIVDPAELTAFLLAPIQGNVESDDPSLDSLLTGYSVTSESDLTDAPGLTHLSYALNTDSNYDWDKLVSSPPTWKWAFRFSRNQEGVVILFNGDFDTVGKLLPDSSEIEVLSCAPMAETLREYFLAEKSGLPAASDTGASKPSE